MRITSSVLEKEQYIPQKYTCNGAGISPPLEIEDIPPEAVSLVLVMDDPDAPGGTFTHWLVWNVSADTSKIEENSLPAGAVEGINSSGEVGYYPPCPPSGVHRYFFRLYALKDQIDLESGAQRSKLEEAMAPFVVGSASFMKKCAA
ncbi:MAG: YbhB/YbcL family Raf kinase inhibitor-like protein [Patescibacteria group bacterium]|nr:YbhB/YbcL family Raf kinase inhibitor-like protein [Patescibacteria group bacterium]